MVILGSYCRKQLLLGKLLTKFHLTYKRDYHTVEMNGRVLFAHFISIFTFVVLFFFLQEETTEVRRKGYKKICKIWQRKSPRSYNFERKKNGKKFLAKDGLENRDVKGLNNHIIMDFRNVFAEPAGCHSFNWTWSTTNRVFTIISITIYKLLAALIAIPFALSFGILFAVSAVISVFLCTPLGVLLAIPLNALSKVSP